MIGAFEYNDAKVKTTLIMIKMHSGKIKYSGIVRVTDANGDTTIRLSPLLDNGHQFDDMEVVNQDKFYATDSDIGMTHFDPDWGLSLDIH